MHAFIQIAVAMDGTEPEVLELVVVPDAYKVESGIESEGLHIIKKPIVQQMNRDTEQSSGQESRSTHLHHHGPGKSFVLCLM